MSSRLQGAYGNIPYSDVRDPRFKSLLVTKQHLYTAFGMGCKPLLHCLNLLGLVPSVVVVAGW